MGSKPGFPHAPARMPGCVPSVPGALKLLSRVQRSPQSLAQLPGVGHNSQVFWSSLPKGREERGAELG